MPEKSGVSKSKGTSGHPVGRGERFQVDYTHGTKRTSTFNSNLVKPLHDRARTALGASLFQQIAEFPPSGFRELNRGIRTDLVNVVNFSKAQRTPSHSLRDESWP